jgi:hypothetical protein
LRPPLVTPDARARILVADDNADMRAFVCRLLGDRWQVEAVADGLAALKGPAPACHDVAMRSAGQSRRAARGGSASCRARVSDGLLCRWPDRWREKE